MAFALLPVNAVMACSDIYQLELGPWKRNWSACLVQVDIILPLDVSLGRPDSDWASVLWRFSDSDT